jgi:hypothetical protein
MINEFPFTTGGWPYPWVPCNLLEITVHLLLIHFNIIRFLLFLQATWYTHGIPMVYPWLWRVTSRLRRLRHWRCCGSSDRASEFCAPGTRPEQARRNNDARAGKVNLGDEEFFFSLKRTYCSYINVLNIVDVSYGSYVKKKINLSKRL